jgi:hypothetical protein
MCNVAPSSHGAGAAALVRDLQGARERRDRCGTLGGAVVRLALVTALAALASPLAAAHARSQPIELLPGVTYERQVEFTPHGPVTIHVVRGPRPVGLYRLRPSLARDAVTGRETVTSMQRRLVPQATSVGVNGDFFSLADGRPSGIVLRDGVLATPPNPGRSSLGIGLDGLLDVRRVALRATWAAAGVRRPIDTLNKAPRRNGVALFTGAWGRVTPGFGGGSVAVVLEPFPAASPNADLESAVSRVVEGGMPMTIPEDGAVLVARGAAAALLREEAPVGAAVTVRLSLRPDWSQVADAIGGGPALVKDGAPLLEAGEAFSTAQLLPRNPRSAVGQRADGRILLVTTDGRRPGYSVGMTNFELALTMVRLGAVRAMALDSGGSATLAFDGRVLNRPSDGRERPVGSALMLEYRGAYVPPPLEPVVSPNGDGVADRQRLSYRLAASSEVTVTLTAPSGETAFAETAMRAPGTYAVPFPPPAAVPEGLPRAPVQPAPLAEGRWTMIVSASDEQGLVSSMARRFSVNSTLGFLRVEPAVVRQRPAGRAVSVRWRLTRAARVRLTVETSSGAVIQSIPLGQRAPGRHEASWNGRRSRGAPVPPGRYVLRLSAVNEVGVVALERSVVVRRAARPSG